jgi:seryl-tRNA synthetase
MLDIKLIRERPDFVRERLSTRGVEADLDGLLARDARRRAAITEGEQLKSERNTRSKEIGALIRSDPVAAAAGKEAVRRIGERIAELDRLQAELEVAVRDQLLALPNLPAETVPVGPDASANRLVRVVGQPPELEGPAQAHWDIAERLGILDLKRGAKVTGSGFPFLVGPGARLSRGLIQYMLDLHTREHGYTEVAAPFLVNTASALGTGQLPKSAEEMYHSPTDDLWLIPTAEVPLTNFHRDEILTGPLPIKLTGYSPCFRREAGAAGKDTRGLKRLHQFDKVELVKFTAPETSFAELESLLADAERVLQRLGLHYRVIELCTGDTGFGSCKTYDIELWAPGQNEWLEVSSCSNFGDFQARRANIRHRTADGKNAFVHTLNGSGVALPRLMVALLECGLQGDGSVVFPPALHPYLGFERLCPP